MKIKVSSAELNRMMKTVSRCISPIDAKYENVEIISANNMLAIRSTNGSIAAVMTTPLIGCDMGSFCVDGAMFARVCSMCNGNVEITTDDKSCTVKGTGRTRIPTVNVKIPRFERISGPTVTIQAEDFNRCYGAVAYAISTELTRIVLTGVKMKTSKEGLTMVAMDGYQMAVEHSDYDGEDCVSAVIPGAVMKLISQSVLAGEKIKLTFSKSKVQAETKGVLISGSLLANEFPDYNRIMPKEFTTESLVDTDMLRDALKSGSVVNTANNLVMLYVGDSSLAVMSNSCNADYSADMPCETQGKSIAIALNQRYLMNTLNAIGSEKVVMKFNSPVSPCVICGLGQDGEHLVLPVRVHENNG